MKKIFSGRKLCLSLLAICCATAVIGNFIGQVSAKESKISDKYSALKTFTDVLSLVEKNYVEPIDVETSVEGAVKGMLQTLDPHSGYLPVDMYKELQVETKGKFGGLGIEITAKNGLLTVVSPIEDSPAARAGVNSGDQIIKIADEFTKDMSLLDAVKKLRGPKGTPITISVHREGMRDLIPITIIRDIIKVRSVRHRMLEPGFAYVRLAQFQDGSADEFLKSLAALKQESPEQTIRGMVLDMRNNPGGLLNQAVRVSDIFLKDGLIVYTEGRLESQRQKFSAHDDGDEPDFPLVVLINGGSASASEIVAGALQDSGRALVIGQQSFGKGSVQTILPMERGDALRLTTALYYTRNGRSIQAEGITPDVPVQDKRYPKDSEEVLPNDKETEGYRPESIKEKDLPGYFKNPKKQPSDKQGEPAGEEAKDGADAQKGGAKGKKEDEFAIGSRDALSLPLEALLKNDPQLEEALRLLKTWNIFKTKPSVQAQNNSSSLEVG